MSEQPVHAQSLVYTEADIESTRQALHSRHAVRTICNVIRRLHTVCTTPEQRALCEEILFMAKRMNARLCEYKKDWSTGLWAPEPDGKLFYYEGTPT